MRLLPALFAFAAVAAVAAPAQATLMDTTTAVLVGSLDGRLGAEPVTVPILVEYTYTAGIAFAPTKVDLSVVEAPEWLTAAVSPGSVHLGVVDSAAPGLTVTRVAKAELTLHAPDAPSDASGLVRVSATAATNGNLKGSTGSDGVLVVTEAKEASDCDGATVAAVDGRTTEEELAASEVTAQSAGFAPATAPAVGGLALAGAAVGGLVALRRK